MVDARLPDGSRVNAIIPPLALDGPMLSIRRFGRSPLTVDDLLRLATRSPRRWCVRAARHGAGAAEHPHLRRHRLRQDDAAQLPLVVHPATTSASSPSRTRPSCSSSSRTSCRLETRPANIEGRGEVTQRDLVRNSLRMRPDRIVVGEVRGAEALDMLQAMNTGHDGSISTIHANSPRDALSRLEMMMLMAGFDLPAQAMRQQIASAIDLIVQVARLTRRHAQGRTTSARSSAWRATSSSYRTCSSSCRRESLPRGGCRGSSAPPGCAAGTSTAWSRPV